MKQHFFVGVDGGGTKTTIRVEDESGCLLGRVQTGPSNIRLSVFDAFNAIQTGLASILSSHGLSLSDSGHSIDACLGLAGGELSSARLAFLSQAHPFTRLELVSDAHIACYGAHGGQNGAVIIAGTGVIGYQIEGGQSARVSGYGFPHDDEGGGAYLGFEAVKHALKVSDQRAPNDLLALYLMNHFTNVDALIEFANTANSTQYAALAPMVFQCAALQNAKANDILKTAGAHLDSVWAAMKRLRQAPAMGFSCALVGGISASIKPYLGQDLLSSLVPALLSPDEGAILWLRRTPRSL